MVNDNIFVIIYSFYLSFLHINITWVYEKRHNKLQWTRFKRVSTDCRSVSHKILFEILPSEYDGGAVIVRDGRITLIKQDTCIRS